jgi:hypothetical protein
MHRHRFKLECLVLWGYFSGAYALRLDYVPPGSQKAWVAFWAGGGSLPRAAVPEASVPVIGRHRRRRSTAAPMSAHDAAR